MIRCDAEWLRKLADLVEAGEVEVGRVELKTGGVMMGVLQPGTLLKYEDPFVAAFVEKKP